MKQNLFLLFLSFFLTFNTFSALTPTTKNTKPRSVTISPFFKEKFELPIFSKNPTEDSSDSESSDDELSFYPKPKKTNFERHQLAYECEQINFLINGLKKSHKQCRQMLPITWFSNLNKHFQKIIFTPEQTETIYEIAKKNNTDYVFVFLDEQKKLTISADIGIES